MKILLTRVLLWWILCAAVACGFLSGCGQKGDLYLPEPKARGDSPSEQVTK